MQNEIPWFFCRSCPRPPLPIPAAIVYETPMLTKVIIILALLVLLFGFGKDKRTGLRNKWTNLLLGVVIFLLATLTLTTLFK
ncbi:MAG: hypothetical protein KKB70_03730 [Proteobacteria bacterium]|nr:hypothetical protein [Pseudomonadota bacterium]MBU1612465.1 hypothetical protein [Pseudomonadota bacterium]